MDLKSLKLGSLAVTVLTLLLTAPSGVNAKDRDNNPPGPAGGRGTNWENPPGAKGGSGASPDRRHKKHQRHNHWCTNHPNAASCTDRDNNPPGAVGGAGTNWENPAGPAGGAGASPN